MDPPTYAELAELMKYLLSHVHNLPPGLLSLTQRIDVVLGALPFPAQSVSLYNAVFVMSL